MKKNSSCSGKLAMVRNASPGWKMLNIKPIDGIISESINAVRFVSLDVF